MFFSTGLICIVLKCLKLKIVDRIEWCKGSGTAPESLVQWCNGGAASKEQLLWGAASDKSRKRSACQLLLPPNSNSYLILVPPNNETQTSWLQIKQIYTVILFMICYVFATYWQVRYGFIYAITRTLSSDFHIGGDKKIICAVLYDNVSFCVGLSDMYN